MLVRPLADASVEYSGKACGPAAEQIIYLQGPARYRETLHATPRDAVRWSLRSARFKAVQLKPHKQRCCYIFMIARTLAANIRFSLMRMMMMMMMGMQRA